MFFSLLLFIILPLFKLIHCIVHFLLLFSFYLAMSFFFKLAKEITIRGKILEGENFSELMALKSLARKNLANLLVVY